MNSSGPSWRAPATRSLEPNHAIAAAASNGAAMALRARRPSRRGAATRLRAQTVTQWVARWPHRGRAARKQVISTAMAAGSPKCSATTLHWPANGCQRRSACRTSRERRFTDAQENALPMHLATAPGCAPRPRGASPRSRPAPNRPRSARRRNAWTQRLRDATSFRRTPTRPDRRGRSLPRSPHRLFARRRSHVCVGSPPGASASVARGDRGGGGELADSLPQPAARTPGRIMILPRQRPVRSADAHASRRHHSRRGH